MKTEYLQTFISFGITKLATNHSLRVSHFPQNNKVLRKVSSKMVLIEWNHDLWQFKYEIDNHLLFREKKCGLLPGSASNPALTAAFL